jgi:hypothetical protein
MDGETLQLIVSGLAVLGLVLIALFFLPALFGGPPYVPTADDKFLAALKLADIKAGEQVVDLGSGDGRFLIDAARAGAQAMGYEINPLLVWRSRRTIEAAGFSAHAQVKWKNFWSADCRQADVVIIYGFQQIMERLSTKLKQELPSGARLVSVHYELPGVAAAAVDHDVRLYRF